MKDHKAPTHEINIRLKSARDNCPPSQTNICAFLSLTYQLPLVPPATFITFTILSDFIEGRELVALLYFHAYAKAHTGFRVAEKFLDVHHPPFKVYAKI